MKKPAIIAWVTGLGLAAILTYPTIIHPASMARQNSDDGKFSVWNVAFVAHQLLTDPAHLYDANIFYPAKGALAYSEANLVAGALAVPVYAITHNPIAAHNSVVYAVIVFAFISMWALVRRLTGSSAAGLVAATGFAFSPYVGARTAEMQLLMVFVFPLTFLACHRFIDAPGSWRAIVLGASLALAGLSSGYYGIFAGMGVGLAIVWFAPWRLRRHRSASPRVAEVPEPGVGPRQLNRDGQEFLRYWVCIAIALLVTAALIAPAFQPYIALRSQPGARGSELDLGEAQGFSATVVEYVRSSSYVHQVLKPLVGNGGAEVLFPGFVVCVFAIVGLGVLRRREPAPRGQSRFTSARVVGFYAVLAVLAVWASFGPKAGLYYLLAKTLPFMSFLRAPARMGVLVVFALAVVAGFGVASVLASRRRAWLAPALVVVTAAELWSGRLSPLTAPWPLVPVDVPPVYRVLASQPRGAVLELQFPYKPGDLFHHARFMFFSMWHWQPLVNGYSDYIPPSFREMAVPINAFPDPESFKIAQAHQTRYVVVHWDTYTNAQDRQEVRDRFPPYAANLKLLYEDERESLYEIVTYPG